MIRLRAALQELDDAIATLNQQTATDRAAAAMLQVDADAMAAAVRRMENVKMAIELVLKDTP